MPTLGVDVGKHAAVEGQTLTRRIRRPSPRDETFVPPTERELAITLPPLKVTPPLKGTRAH